MRNRSAPDETLSLENGVGEHGQPRARRHHHQPGARRGGTPVRGRTARRNWRLEFAAD